MTMSQYSSPMTPKQQPSPLANPAPSTIAAVPAPKPVSKSSKIGPYVLSKTLGMGSTGRVKLGIHQETNEKVAIKIIPKQASTSSTTPNPSLKIEREIVIMKLIQHPNVMQLYDVYETDDELYLVLEYVEGGELFDYLVKRGRLDEKEACSFFQQIIFGLDYCHKHQICHRDLKPENLLLDAQHRIKIADFGMASLQRPDRMLETSCGSPHYASPEIIKGIKYDGSKSDIWSCGVILYALMSGNLPFDDENIRRLLSKVKTGKFVMPQHISCNAQDLITRMLNVDPDLRMTMDEIINHPWFNQVCPPEIMAVSKTILDHPPIPEDELDADILNSLGLIGWTDSVSLQEALVSGVATPEKVYYHLLRIRKEQYYYNNLEPSSSFNILNESDDGNIRRRAESLASVFTERKSRRVHHQSETSLLVTSPPESVAGSKQGIHKPTHSSPLSINTKSQNSLTAKLDAPPTPVKKSWFAQLISSFKPYMIQVNHQSLNVAETTHVLKTRILPDLNIKVQEGRKSGIKCKSEIPLEIQRVAPNDAGDAAMIKFRIDLTEHPSTAGCVLTFSLQHGPMVALHYIIRKLNDQLGSVGVGACVDGRSTIINDISHVAKSVVHTAAV